MGIAIGIFLGVFLESEVAFIARYMESMARL